MMILPLLLPMVLALQSPSDTYAILKEEYSRSESIPVLRSALTARDVRLQRLALRAIGRLERPALRDDVVPLLKSADAGVRREAVAALAQLRAVYDFASLLQGEQDGKVRAAIYESIGRAKAGPVGEAVLVEGLLDSNVDARAGAARGLETLIRLNIKTLKLADTTLAALRAAFKANETSPLRQFVRLALNAAGDRDAPTLDLGLSDQDPQVRRLAVMGSGRFVDDASAIVRFEGLRVAGNCDRALAAVGDVSGHVSLAAVDFLGAKACPVDAVEALVQNGKTWRVRAHALVALAKISPEKARARIPSFFKDPTWQVRVYAAEAAKLAKDATSLGVFAVDGHPNVAAAALTTVADARRALASNHSGLLLAAAAKLKGSADLMSAAPMVVGAIQRLSASGRATVRDPRVRLMELVAEMGETSAVNSLRPLLVDRDPVVAALAAKILTEKTGVVVEAKTTRYLADAFPSEAVWRSIQSLEAEFAIKDVGVFRAALMADQAPATVAKFVSLVKRGAYNGLTFHRVVPNFVLQGGSPGADEYDALTPQFMRDEVGLASHARGTFGISTRGRDTGDGQIFINLIDNWRLDHVYTVFATTTSGMDVVDSILEGDVIEKVQIIHRRP